MTIFSNFGDYLRPFDSSSHHGVTLNRNWISRPNISLMITEIWAQLDAFPSLSGPKNGKKQGFESFFGPFSAVMDVGDGMSGTSVDVPWRQS